MSSTSIQPQTDGYKERLVEALWDIEEDLETVAQADVPFSENARAALEWLEAHESEVDNVE